MKKIRINISALICIAILAFSNTKSMSAQGGEVGVRLMPTFSNFDAQSSTGGTIEGQVTLGWGFGAFVGFNFNEHIGIQVEGIYTTLSQKYVENDQENKVRLNYFNVPLLLSLNTGKDKSVNLNVVAGPQIGFSSGSKIESTGGNDSLSTTAILSVKKGDLGFAYGAGLDFGLNPDKTLRFGIGFRGVFGLIDISDNNRTMTNDSYYLLDRTKVKTYAGYVGISYIF